MKRQSDGFKECAFPDNQDGRAIRDTYHATLFALPRRENVESLSVTPALNTIIAELRRGRVSRQWPSTKVRMLNQRAPQRNLLARFQEEPHPTPVFSSIVSSRKREWRRPVRAHISGQDVDAMEQIAKDSASPAEGPGARCIAATGR